MKRLSCYILITLIAAIPLGMAAYYKLQSMDITIDRFNSLNRPPKIHPDYTDTVIPPNIAPLNFRLREDGREFYVKIYSNQGKPIYVRSRKQLIKMPVNKWKNLLDSNRGQRLYFDIYTRDDEGKWSKFETITNTIANSDIDSHLVYRRLRVCAWWKDMATYQRNLETFKESILLHNRSYEGGCANCHTFLKNSPDNMLMQIRSSQYGTPILTSQKGKVSAINTRTNVSPGKAGFSSWHPNANIIAFSINKFSLIYHSATPDIREVVDTAADLVLYRIDTNKVSSSGKITDPNRMETYPEFSPDGKYLYFTSAPQLPSSKYRQVLYDLMRVGYDAEKQQFGPLETVLTAEQLGGSITQPRFSPDGRYLLFNVCLCSDFPVNQPISNLFLLEIRTGKFTELPINSKYSESWHGWSSNGRWIVFSSKRLDGRFSKPFFSYIDENGKTSKPFVLPQKDPAYYDSLLQVYSIPEFITRPIKVKAKQFAKTIFTYSQVPQADAITGATPNRPAPPIQSADQAEDIWPSRE